MALDNAEAMKHVTTDNFIFTDHSIINGGLLPDDRRAHACWYYCRVATKNLRSVDEGATYAHELDHVNMINNIARSVALLYRLDSPDDFLQFMDTCKAEVRRIGGTWDHRIERPGTQPHRKEAN